MAQKRVPRSAKTDQSRNDDQKPVTHDLPPERLQKVLSRTGVGSRREVEAWIEEGRITVNREVAIPGQKVTVEDAIALDGKRISIESAQSPVRRVLMYNKPEGEVTTRKDPEGRPTVFDRLPKLRDQRWIAIGRLDINTTGLMLFTTDGELANRLMHPSYQVDREYAVRVFGQVDDAMLQRLLTGVLLDDGMAKFSDISAAGGAGINKWYHVTLFEGRNREVRRLWESQDVKVSRLKRVRFGPAFLPSRLSVGRWDEMEQKEIDALSKMVGLEPLAIPAKTPDEQAAQRRQQGKRPNKGSGAGGFRKGSVSTRPLGKSSRKDGGGSERSDKAPKNRR
ncbi:23S rRNA pseudouridine(2605) synthase RluB [Marinobacter sp. BGYM27]|uniref:23S rRNA pseudouridine(2605) synthase RluB n=1 Tax=Marinobacter sp. BGYM27 TaxID=2975597 RepID=UPI0021A537BF|nr:23S rRNA pseudouridine(2605) synthase RluB [Marinobacter sp. BGYM27]MDG5500399.1 23S rRNA pseudouridine(2605) synthase RluB [Marinobacter sp. BGYM27]